MKKKKKLPSRKQILEEIEKDFDVSKLSKKSMISNPIGKSLPLYIVENLGCSSKDDEDESYWAYREERDIYGY